MIKTDDELIARFFEGRTSTEENDALADWMEAGDENRKQFNDALKAWLLMTFPVAGADRNGSVATTEKAADAAAAGESEGLRKIWLAKARPSNRRRLHLPSLIAGMAAALAIFITGIRTLPKQDSNGTGGERMSITAEPGHLSTLTLADGSKVTLNGGSTLTFPTSFGRTRDVQLSGEAYFEVAKDKNRPFTIGTYKYRVRVTGTAFNVLADKEYDSFSIALREGSVTVDGRDENLNLRQGQMVASKGGEALHYVKDSDIDSRTLWKDGILLVTGVPFDELMRSMERSYGVHIVIDREALPVIHYIRMKIQVSDGITHALNALQRRSDFSYSYDENSNTYHIR